MNASTNTLLSTLLDHVGDSPKETDLAIKSYAEFCKALSADSRFARYSPEALKELVNTVISQHMGEKGITDISKTVDAAHRMLAPTNYIESLKSATPDLSLVAEERITTAPKVRSPSRSSGFGGSSQTSTAAATENTFVEAITKTRDRLKSMPSEQKITSGINFLVSGLFAASAFSQLRQGFAKDETTGERHIQPTQMGMGIVLALLAAGSAYLGAKPLMLVTR